MFRSFRRAVALLAFAALPLSPALAGGEWLTSTHPCPGANRTDALHRDTDGTLWVGCGTNAAGYGLFLSEDGGITWVEAVTSPATILDTFRISSISRGEGDDLYVAGIDNFSATMIVRLGTTATPFDASVALASVPQLGRSFHVGTYRALADGHAIAESLNGNDLLYYVPGISTSSASTWTAYRPASQILDLTVHNDRFWGCGSTIAEPPQLFLPPLGGMAQPYEFVIDRPATATVWDGELWGLAVNAARLVAVGVDQDDDVGKIFVSGNAPRNMAQYSELSVSQILGDANARTWARGVCMRGPNVAVVGERQPLGAGTGLVLLSDNGGDTFVPVTPANVTASVSKCLFEPDGTLVVAGAAGFVGILPPDPAIFASGFEVGVPRVARRQ